MPKHCNHGYALLIAVEPECWRRVPRCRTGACATPRGPKGEKRPADVIGAAVKVMKIAKGEIEEETDAKPTKNFAAAELERKGGQARAKKLSKKRRAEIAKSAAKKCWGA